MAHDDDRHDSRALHGHEQQRVVLVEYSEVRGVQVVRGVTRRGVGQVDIDCQLRASMPFFGGGHIYYVVVWKSGAPGLHSGFLHAKKMYSCRMGLSKDGLMAPRPPNTYLVLVLLRVECEDVGAGQFEVDLHGAPRLLSLLIFLDGAVRSGLSNAESHARSAPVVPPLLCCR